MRFAWSYHFISGVTAAKYLNSELIGVKKEHIILHITLVKRAGGYRMPLVVPGRLDISFGVLVGSKWGIAYRALQRRDAGRST